MKSPLLSAMLLLTLLTLSAHGQYCSPVERSGFTGGSVSLLTTSRCKTPDFESVSPG